VIAQEFGAPHLHCSERQSVDEEPVAEEDDLLACDARGGSDGELSDRLLERRHDDLDVRVRRIGL